jgi:Flp pilus assembly protein TadD
VSPADDVELQFDLALQAGRLRGDEPQSASAFLDQLRQDSNPLVREHMRMLQSRLLIALEDRGEAALLKYLKGDQEGGNEKEFMDAAQDFEAALRLAPGAQFDESRAKFCRGRALIYAKQYARAVELLEQAIRLDPTRAYAYNALGIAYLEQVSLNVRNFEYATAAFQDAINRAPYWAYPRHNLALALTQRGEFQRAAAEYRGAMDVGPYYSYLPYNLGLLYQQIADFPRARHITGRPWRSPANAVSCASEKASRHARNDRCPRPVWRRSKFARAIVARRAIFSIWRSRTIRPISLRLTTRPRY